MYVILKRNQYYGPQTGTWQIETMGDSTPESYETLEEVYDVYRDAVRCLSGNVSHVEIRAHRVRKGVTARDLYNAITGCRGSLGEHVSVWDVVSKYGHDL